VGSNVLWHELSGHIDEVHIGNRGRKQRFPGIEDCDGVILLGYHAMAGTDGGVLEHTMTSEGWQNFWLNDKPHGEIGIDAAIAGDYGKPIIMVSGCNHACAEASALLPDVVTAEVKKGLSVYGAKLLLKDAAHALIRERAAQAVKKAPHIKPYSVQKPLTARLEMTERGFLPHSHLRPNMRIINSRTYEVTANTMEEALFNL